MTTKIRSKSKTAPKRDSNGRFVTTAKTGARKKTTTKTKTKRTSKTKATAKPVTHVAFLLDRSTSMAGLRYEAVATINDQIKVLQDKAGPDQEVRASYYTFSSVVDAPTIFDKEASALVPLKDSDYFPNGSTALLDAVGKAVLDLRALPYSKKPNVSFLLVVITDGQENQSTHFNRYNLRALLDEVQATDRWSLAFLVPKGHADGVSADLNVARGNFQEWKTTTKGAQQANVVVRSSLDSYMRSRTSGTTYTKNFFQTDLSTIKPSDLKKNLVDASGAFRQWKVNSEQPIKGFVESHGQTYEIGKAFYELTKKEDVQGNKAIAIMDRKTGKIYTGDSARDLLGIPSGGTIRVEPGNHMTYAVFVMSTSTNRKLVRGTTLLYATA